MCVIICLEPKQEIPFDLFQNACYNNEHGFGMVVKDKKKKNLKVIKKLDYDIKEVYDLINSYSSHERFIHLRWTTVGETTEENLHPFEVYKGKDNHVCFMHNGTLQRYKNKIPYTDDKTSDSQFFAKNYLTPVLSEIRVGNISGSIHSHTFEFILEECWPRDLVNRGILISAKEDTIFLNETIWKTIEGKNKEEIKVSNDSYFDTLSRGTKFEEEKKKELANKQVLLHPANSSNSSISDVNNFHLGEVYQLKSNEVEKLFSGYEIYDSDNISLLAAVTRKEWECLFENDRDAGITVLQILATEVYELEQHNLTLEEKHRKATKQIAELKKGSSGE